MKKNTQPTTMPPLGLRLRGFIRRFVSASGAALAMLLLAPVVSAQLPMLKDYAYSQIRTDWTGDIGIRFTTGPAPVNVTKLGFYDNGKDGLATAHQVGIWKLTDGSLVTSVTVPAGTAGELVGNFRYATLTTQVTLAVNTTYVIGGETFSGGDAWPGSLGTSTTVPGFNPPDFTGFLLVGDNLHSGAGFTRPEVNWETGKCAASCNLIGAIPPTHTITASAGTGGTISPSGATVVYEGTSPTFTITATPGYAIAQVTVDGVDQGALGSYTFTNVTGDHTIAATFASTATWTIAVTQGANGTITPAGTGGLVTVSDGANQTFAITPSAGYGIATVLVDGVNNPGAVTAGSYTFTNVTANGHTISATFAVTPRPMLAGKGSGGTRTDGPWTIGYKFTTGPSPVYVTQLGFVDIGLDGLAAAHQVGIWKASDNSLVTSTTVPTGTGGALSGDFRYAPLPFMVTLAASTTYVIGAEVFNNEDAWMISAASPGFTAPEFNGFAMVESDYHSGAGLTMPGSTWVTGQCAPLCNLIGDIVLPPTPTITASAGTGGTISPSGAAAVPDGANPTFTIAADPGYAINQVLIDGFNDDTAVASGSYTFGNVTGDHTIEATFVSTATWTITVTQGANGTITPDPALVSNGANRTFTITPNPRYQIADVLVDGSSVGAVSSHTFTNVTADGHTISASFAAIAPLVDVNLASVSGGDVTSIPNGGSLGGNFTVDGTGTAPVVTIVDSKKAIQLNLTGTTLLLNGAAATPNSVLGLNGSGGAGANPVYTILATVYRPDFVDAPNGCIFASFAPYRNGAGFCYGNTPWVANHWMAGATMTVDNPSFYNTNAPAGSWHTLLFTSDGSSESLYIDGATTPVATTTGPTSFHNEYNNNRYPIRLGGTDMGDGSGLGSLYQGAIGSLQIWSIPTAAADVPAVTAAIAPITPTNTHTVTAGADTGGTIIPSGDVPVLDAGSQAFTITADPGYVIQQVLVDGASNPAAVSAGSYTFTNVTADHTITATFAVASAGPYADWLARFTFAPGADTSETGDPDGDGMTNQQEFAFGLDPTSGKSCNPITVPFDKTTGKFRYTRTATSGLTYTVWTSTNLQAWAEEAYPVNETVTGTVDGVETVEVTVAATPVGGKLFVRVKAE